MAHKHPVIQRDETIRSILLGVFVLVTAITLVLSDRVLFYGTRSKVIPGAIVPKGALPDTFKGTLDDYGVHIPKFARRPLLSIGAAPDQAYDTLAQATPLHFGYSIREGAAIGLPFTATTEHGHVLYYETPHEYVIAPITDDYLRQVKVPMAKPLDAGDYAYWPHLWGWLFVLALIGIGAFELGAQRRRRDALGMI